jgi:hypothetical protein
MVQMWSPLRLGVSPSEDEDDDPRREPWTLEDVNVWFLVGIVTIAFVVGIGTSLLVRVL